MGYISKVKIPSETEAYDIFADKSLKDGDGNVISTTYFKTADAPKIGTADADNELKKIEYTEESAIPPTPNVGTEYACTDFIGYNDLDSNLQEKIDSAMAMETKVVDFAAGGYYSGKPLALTDKMVVTNISDGASGGGNSMSALTFEDSLLTTPGSKCILYISGHTSSWIFAQEDKITWIKPPALYHDGYPSDIYSGTIILTYENGTNINAYYESLDTALYIVPDQIYGGQYLNVSKFRLYQTNMAEIHKYIEFAAQAGNTLSINVYNDAPGGSNPFLTMGSDGFKFGGVYREAESGHVSYTIDGTIPSGKLITDTYINTMGVSSNNYVDYSRRVTVSGSSGHLIGKVPGIAYCGEVVMISNSAWTTPPTVTYINQQSALSIDSAEGQISLKTYSTLSEQYYDMTWQDTNVFINFFNSGN